MIGSGAVAWRSKRQTMLSESSTEAELQGQSETSSMAIGTKELAAELGCKVLASQRCDNRSTIAQVAGGTSWRTRALTSRARCLRQRVQVYELYLGHIPGAVHPGDGLTKHLGRIAHRQAVCLWCLDGPDTHQFVADYEGLMVEGDNVFFDETAQVAMEDDELINAGSSGDGGDDDFTFMQFDPYEEAYNGMVKLISNVAVNVIRQSATMATTAADLGPAVAPIIKSTELRCDCPKCPEQVCDLLTANIMSALFGAGCGAAAMSYCCVRCCRGQALQSSDDDDVDDEFFDVVESRNVATMTTTEWHQNKFVGGGPGLVVAEIPVQQSMSSSSSSTAAASNGTAAAANGSAAAYDTNGTAAAIETMLEASRNDPQYRTRGPRVRAHSWKYNLR